MAPLSSEVSWSGVEDQRVWCNKGTNRRRWDGGQAIRGCRKDIWLDWANTTARVQCPAKKEERNKEQQRIKSFLYKGRPQKRKLLFLWSLPKLFLTLALQLTLVLILALTLALKLALALALNLFCFLYFALLVFASLQHFLAYCAFGEGACPSNIV